MPSAPPTSSQSSQALPHYRVLDRQRDGRDAVWGMSFFVNYLGQRTVMARRFSRIPTFDYRYRHVGAKRLTEKGLPTDLMSEWSMLSRTIYRAYTHLKKARGRSLFYDSYSGFNTIHSALLGKRMTVMQMDAPLVSRTTSPDVLSSASEMAAIGPQTLMQTESSPHPFPSDLRV
ncbi:unnamed protein product [Pleuronectes platessa]|uniref:Uncharacterized protein n=1 Tax=Pleuronectes platessa TaxID=8262 RepID=A0A9N7V6D1_PLEPL|nr:unnamed protein product [Pleuronectes platessa]